MSPLDKDSRGRKDTGKELPVSEFGQPFDMVVDDSLFDASGVEEKSIETPLKEDSLLNFNRQGSSQETSPDAGENAGGSVFDLDRELVPPSRVDEEKPPEDILQTEGTSLGWPFTEEDQPTRPSPVEAPPVEPVRPPPVEPLQEDSHGIDALFADEEQTGLDSLDSMETSSFDFPEEESQGVDVLFAEAKRQKPKSAEAAESVKTVKTAETTEAPRAAMPEPQPRIIEPLPAEAPAAEALPPEQSTTEEILADAIPATSDVADLFADENASDDFPPLDADAPAMSSEDSALLESFAHAAVPLEQQMMPELEQDPLEEALQPEEKLPFTETPEPVEDALETPVELAPEMEFPTPSLDEEIPESLATDQETDELSHAERETEFTDEDLEGLPLFDDMDEGIEDSFEPSADVSGSSETFSFKGGEVESIDGAEETKSPGGRFLRFPLAIPALPRKGLIIGIGVAAAAIILLAGVLAVLTPSEIEDTVPGETTLNTTDTVPPVSGGDPLQVKDPSSTASGTGGDQMGHTMTDGFDPSVNKGASDLQLKGMSLFRDKRYVEAIEAFERDITSSTLFLARCYQILGENEEALKRYQRVLWEYPDRSAFIEVFALAEEMFAAGDYEAARKLYYAFLAQEDRMPGSVSKLASKAYFKIGRCLEKEALDLLEGGGAGEESRDNPEDPLTGRATSLAGTGDLPKSSWILSPPARIELRSNQVNDLYTTFSMECVGAPGIQVFERLAKESGRELQIEEGLEERLSDEVVSAFLKDRRLETILEYITGQLGLTYTLDRQDLSIADLETRINGDWLAMKNVAVKTLRSSLYRFRGHEDSAKVYFEISRLHCLSGEFDSAIDPARTLIVEYPEFSQVPAALLNISSCYLELGDYSKARENLSELISKYPTHPATQEGYLLLARAQWLDGNPVAAQLTLRSLNDRFPDSHLRHEGLAVLARILNSLGDFGSVVRLLEGVAPEDVEKKETAVSILLLYSEAHLRRGDPKSAADAAVKMIETFPGNAREKDALYLLAEAYTHLDEHFLAYAQCKVLKERYEETHSDSFLYKTAAQALRELDFRDQALEWLDEGLSRCPAERNATYEMYMLLGDILFEMEMYERAKVVFRKIWGHDALEKDAQIKYVQAQMKQKDYREALRTLRGMEEQAYGDPSHLSEIYKMAGDCFSAMGNMEAAIAAYIGELKDEDSLAREPNENE